MSTQNYANHAHHPVFTYVASGFWLLAFAAYALRWDPRFVTLGLLGVTICLISITRVYTTKLQDRIIMLEERLRAGVLLTPDQQHQFAQLSPKQVVALRFASDAEFAALCEQAIAGRMKPDDIKRAVRDWRSDDRRT
jgi:hypothetical protein